MTVFSPGTSFPLRTSLCLLLSCTPTIDGARLDSGGAGATTQTGPDTDTGTGTSTETGSQGTSFVLDVSVQADPDGLLLLWSNLPADLAGCLALTQLDVPCLDDDEDQLVDAWEDLVLDRLRPVVVLDEDEPYASDPDGLLADVGRVTPAADGDVRVYLMLGWSQDYGRCGLSAHSGDSERVALSLVLEGEQARVSAAYTAAHEGTVLDHGRVWQDDLMDLSLWTDDSSGELRWMVWASEGKHASYGSVDACESVSVIPCVEEDCDPDGVSDPGAWQILPTVANAGEPEAPLLTALDSVGFPGDDAWADQDFCGGQDRTGSCASAVVDKLTMDPF